MKINKLDLDPWVSNQIDPAKLNDHEIARVTSVNKDSFLIRKNEKEIFAEITGKMLYTADSPADLPTVGDWVYTQLYDDESFAVIHEIIPRKSILQRKGSGKTIEYQLIAANIDTAFIIQSCGQDYNLRRLERYLIMINQAKIHPVILLSKYDLTTENDLQEKITNLQNIMPDLKIIPFSNTTQHGIKQIQAELIPQKTFCLLGSSGVGKTTLLNNLLNQPLFETNSVRIKDEKGKHTTTRRQLINLPNNAIIIDTPGMREIANFDSPIGINETFHEINTLSNQCVYRNCTHQNEKGCAILQALQNGEISQERYQSFLKMNKETAYNEMSYLEKKQKDKKFGKMCKSIMKNKKPNNSF